jgi:FixJ family two-component response regulator
VAKEALIAVVDDDSSFRSALVDSLDSLGFDVRGFASAEEFFEGDDFPTWDCIITDIHMRGMSGLDLKRLLVARDCRVPIIMITALPEPDMEARVAASGAICLLIKPFESDALLGCLKQALST